MLEYSKIKVREYCNKYVTLLNCVCKRWYLGVKQQSSQKLVSSVWFHLTFLADLPVNLHDDLPATLLGDLLDDLPADLLG